MKLTKSESLGALYTFYRSLLTPTQQEYFEDYYYDDLSLAEIADNNDVSRQAVYDNIKRSSALLNDYEAKLQLWHNFSNIDATLNTTISLLNKNDITAAKQNLIKLKQTLEGE